jgi:hypothetical protein
MACSTVAEGEGASKGTGEDERAEGAVEEKRPKGEAGRRRLVEGREEIKRGGDDEERRAERTACWRSSCCWS